MALFLFMVERLTAAGCTVKPVEKGKPVSAQKLRHSYCFAEYRGRNLTLAKAEHGDCRPVKLAGVLLSLLGGNEFRQCMNSESCVVRLSVS